MIKIPDSILWLGNAADLRDIRRVLLNVTAIIDLAIEEPLPEIPRVTNYCRFVLTDDGENNPALIRAAIQTAAGFVAGNQSTVICCNAGINRSPAIAAAVLSRLSGKQPAECLKRIASLKPLDINPALWQQIESIIGPNA